MDKLAETKWAIAREYARQFSELMGVQEWHFIGTDDQGQGQPDVIDLDGAICLSMADVMMVIDRLPEWIQRYGTHEGVAEEIMSWQWWWLERDNTAATHPILELWENRRERSLRTYPSINLEHWLMGCPREPRPKSPHDHLCELKVKREMLVELAVEYRENRTLRNIIDNLTDQMKPLQAECDKIDKEMIEKYKAEHPGKWASLEQAIREEEARQP